MQVEEWRAIPGFDGYEASSLGRIRSQKRSSPWVLSLNTDRTGYLRVTLQLGGSARRTRRVHSLVAAAFLGPRSGGLVVRHIDGDQVNNSVANLAYGTPSDNVQDTIRHGRFVPNIRNARLGLRRSHCPQGHEYTPENSYFDRRGHKSCRACRRAVNQAYTRRARTA